MKKKTLLLMLFVATFTWLGSAQTTTWEKANPFAAPAWNPVPPDYTMDVIIDADYLFEDGFIANSLTINAGKTVSIGGTVLTGDAKSIGVVGNFTNNGSIVLGGDASFVQYGTMTTGAGATYKVTRESSDYLEYDYIFYSSPTTTATVNSAFVNATGSSVNHVFTLDTSAFNDADNDMYDDDAEGSEWVTVTDPNAALQAGVGYIVLGSHSDLPFDASGIDTGTTYTDIVEFTGPFNNGDITVSVTQDALATDNSNNLNLLGNPYPSAIDLNVFKNDNNAHLNGKFYFWTHNTQLVPVAGYGYVYTNDDYSLYNANVGAGTAAASGGATPDKFVPSCQSFLAEVKASGTSVTFKNTQRDLANNGGFMSPLDEDDDKIWLNMLGDNGDFRQIFVGFFDEATDGFDDFDSIRLENGENTDFYSVIEGVDSHIAIQGAHTFNIDKVIALGLEIVQEGEYTISIDNFEGVFADGQEIYIYDNATGAIHDLATGGYVFTATIGEVDNRLELRFKSTVGTDEAVLDFVGVYPNPSDAIFNISWRGATNANIQVYDLSGKVIISNTINNVDRTYKLDMSQYNTGFYFVELSVDNYKVVKKLVLK